MRELTTRQAIIINNVVEFVSKRAAYLSEHYLHLVLMITFVCFMTTCLWKMLEACIFEQIAPKESWSHHCRSMRDDDQLTAVHVLAELLHINIDCSMNSVCVDWYFPIVQCSCFYFWVFFFCIFIISLYYYYYYYYHYYYHHHHHYYSTNIVTFCIAWTTLY